MVENGLIAALAPTRERELRVKTVMFATGPLTLADQTGCLSSVAECAVAR
jgi:hypothetical protein